MLTAAKDVQLRRISKSFAPSSAGYDFS